MGTDPKFWEQFGPWCVLAIMLLLAIGFGLRSLGNAFWNAYQRMATALDEQHKSHAAELKSMHERQCVVTENNTRALVIVSERLDRVEDKSGLCASCRKEL